MFLRLAALGLAFAVLGACAETKFVAHVAKRVVEEKEPPASEGIYKVGNPYEIAGIWYFPAEDYGYDETGIASWYGSKFHGRDTANGERFDMNTLSAAHKTLPMPSFVRVTNLENGRSLNLRVNDRGPFVRGRVIDVSRRAAQLLGFENRGTARVRVQILARESQAIAMQIKGEQMLASIGTPITTEPTPSPSVSRASLPPIAGAGAAPARETVRPAAATAVRERAAPEPVQPELGVVSVTAARDTTLYVQAGAFAYFENANQVRARLFGMGEVKVSAVLVNGRDLYRVRVGPLTTVEAADLALDRVIAAGYPDARIIVD
ncbi:MAG: septal ring lytic transglycosylase RlpA family protein [Rhodospirillales bacterium]|nr:septal ring lytic transglycosylase RlpA family protein [Rhodospirillales bacterium]